MTLRCVLVEDHTLVRQAVAAYLAADPQIEVVGEAGTVALARELLSTTVADVVVVDVSLPDGNGLTLTADLRRRNSRVGIVVLTMHDDDATLVGALDAGASALVLKSAPASRIVEAIRHAAVQPGDFLADGLASALRRADTMPRLTAREREVLQLLADGLAVAEVAGRLYLSESTVKTHIAKLYDKLGVHNRAGAVMAAMNLGLVRPTGAAPPAPTIPQFPAR